MVVYTPDPKITRGSFEGFLKVFLGPLKREILALHVCVCLSIQPASKKLKEILNISQTSELVLNLVAMLIPVNVGQQKKKKASSILKQDINTKVISA